jgi:ribonuclease D
MDYKYIKSNRELNAYLRGFEEKKTHVIALDLEAELNRHAYGEKLCLVQIFNGETAVLIDPLNISTQPLKKLFESRNVLKVMYDASSDLSLMKNAYDIDIVSILDLRPAVDLLNYEARNLHSVLAAELGVMLSDKAKFQKQNWMRRPIDRRAIDYALNDVLHLLKLKDAILARLAEAKLLDIFILKNLQVQIKDYTRNPADRYRKVRGYHALAEAERAVFRKLYDVRDKYAQQTRMPVHNIVNNQALIKLAQEPDSIEELKFPRRFKSELTGAILHDLREALQGLPGEKPAGG